ncbi:hypothetical protein QJQ45_022540 [Haematococcus lacustris]|nr:hypothetical protein QJQ45_022540 [Haematococcus lacustris]
MSLPSICTYRLPARARREEPAALASTSWSRTAGRRAPAALHTDLTAKDEIVQLTDYLPHCPARTVTMISTPQAESAMSHGKGSGSDEGRSLCGADLLASEIVDELKLGEMSTIPFSGSFASSALFYQQLSTTPLRNTFELETALSSMDLNGSLNFLPLQSGEFTPGQLSSQSTGNLQPLEYLDYTQSRQRLSLSQWEQQGLFPCRSDLQLGQPAPRLVMPTRPPLREPARTSNPGSARPAGMLVADKNRSQGYRKLWQQVTKVGKGQRLQGGAGLAYNEMTVEDLIRIVVKLTLQESAVEAVEQGLYFLDSSATAALLKELAKQGHLKRSVEIFDWLRSLPATHELSSLCDLYTYTTMISQCGSHQQLRRALELVAEMQGRGIDCNVHTYSALMNVCIKANELELALDVYRQMLNEGCAPNVVTYNILIDVYVKKGQWEEAVRTLDTLEAQAIRAEVRTYNTVISACNKGGEPEQALRVYQRMLAAGVKPSATTYTALICAYGRCGQVDKALEIFQDMVHRGCERNVITYSSLMAACEKAGRWELALELFAQMHAENCKPNTVTYNSLIAACGHGGHWEKATELFDTMAVYGCKPDSVTFSALVTAYEKGGQWRHSLKALEAMQASLQIQRLARPVLAQVTAAGCHPDAALFNSLMEVLWQSGVVLAQARAMQLWSLANRNGQFRIYTNSRQETGVLQYSTVTLTAGAAMVTVLRWLAELRAKLVKEGLAYFRNSVCLVLHKNRTSRAEPLGQDGILQGVSCMLSGAHSPFLATAVTGMAALQVSIKEGSVTLEVGSAQLSLWLNSASFNDLTFLVQGGPLCRLPLDVLLQEDCVVAARCQEAFQAVLRLEETNIVNVSVYPSAVLQQRAQVVNLCTKYGAAFAFREDTVHDSLALFDKLMCSGAPFSTASLWPLGLCCCLLLAAKQTEAVAATPLETGSSWPSYESVALLTGFSTESLLSMEQNILSWLQGDTCAISVLRVLQLYQERLGHYLPEFKPVDRVSQEVPGVLLKLAASPVCLGLRPTLLAAASLTILRRAKGNVPAWPTALQGWHELPKLSAQEIELCHRTFMMIDKNASGCICADQLKLALAILGQQPTEEELFVMIAQIEFVFLASHPGHTHIASQQPLALNYYLWTTTKRCFETIDAFVALGGNADTSGHISTSRLLSVVQEFELTLNVDKLLAELDADNSGQIGYELFKQLLA